MGRFLFLLIIATSLALLGGCAKAKTGVMPAKEEAVRLMDRGENAKAARILEDVLDRNENDDEAKFLLASSYMGLAGIDVYRIFDAFQDVLFRRSLKDQIIAPKEDGKGPPALGNGEIPGKEKTKSKTEEAMASLDRTLTSFQLALVYLDRFPQVPDEKWPYMEAALARLESMEDPTIDTFTYRVLIRLIYSKSYLISRVVRNDRIWSREWACKFDAQDFDLDLQFFTRQAIGIDSALERGAAKGSKTLEKARKNFSFLTDAANSADGFSSWNDGLTFSELESFIKDRFNCN